VLLQPLTALEETTLILGEAACLAVLPDLLKMKCVCQVLVQHQQTDLLIFFSFFQICVIGSNAEEETVTLMTTALLVEILVAH
jgi:hypothetical protein